MTYTALGLLFGPGENALSLVVGLPVELLTSPDAKSVVRGLRKWLIDRHTFTIDGAFHIMDIEQVKPAPQPLGTYLDWGFDRHGQWKKSKADLALPVGVLDIGFNSVDLFAVKDGAITRRYTSGRNLGVRRSVEIVKEQIHRDYGIDQSYGEIDGLIREYVKTKGRTVQLAVPGGSTNANENVDLAINMAAGELTAFVESQWGNGSAFSHILLTGGGSIVMGRFFARSFPHAEIMPAPAEANARGLAKLAARQGFLRG